MASIKKLCFEAPSVARAHGPAKYCTRFNICTSRQVTGLGVQRQHRYHTSPNGHKHSCTLQRSRYSTDNAKLEYAVKLPPLSRSIDFTSVIVSGDASPFGRLEPAGMITHSTTKENYDSIVRDSVLKGSRKPTEYDGIFRNMPADAPMPVYFKVQHNYGDTVLPLSSYPKHLGANDPVKILSIHLDTFASDAYRMYLVGCTPTQFGPDYMKRVHSHVVFATSEHWQWLEDNGAVRLAKSDNAILVLTDAGWLMATEFLGHIEGNHADADSSRAVKCAHSVNVVLLDRLALDGGACDRPAVHRWTSGVRVATHRVAHGDYRFMCPVSECSHGFQSMTRLEDHYIAAHTDLKPFRCSFDDCFEVFSSRRLRDRHSVRHEGFEGFPCTADGCSYVAMEEGILRRHEVSHSDSREHACSFDGCNEMFARRSYLIAHERTHSDEKPYACRWCSFVSAHSRSLKRHERTHAGNKQTFACTMEGCTFTAVQLSDLQRHRLSHMKQAQAH